MKNITTKRLLFTLLVTAVVVVLGTFLLSRTISLDKEQKDWLYLADIIHTNTKGEKSATEKLAKMTDWFHENVEHVSKYPPNFDGSSVISVIRGGVGNCGFQSSNISVIADIMGYPEHRIYHCSKERGAAMQHAFAEIKVDGQWKVYDPDMVQYVRDEQGDIMGVKEMIQNPGRVEHVKFKKLVPDFNKQPPIYQVTYSMLPLVQAFGEGAFKKYSRGGKTGFMMQLAFGKYGFGLLLVGLLGGYLIAQRLYRKPPPKKVKGKKKKK